MEPLAGIIKVYLITIIRYSILAGIPFLCFYKFFKNKFIQNKIQHKVVGNKEFTSEFIHSAQASLVLAAVGFLFIFTPLKSYTLIYSKISMYPVWWIPVSLLLALILHDTYFYWMHRLLHNKKIFPIAHVIHHKSTNPSPWASYSFHFIEAFTEALIAPIILFTLPVHPIAIFLFSLISFLINVYGHLGFEIAPKWFRKSFLFEVLNSSVYHNLHHRKFKGNYALYFRIWDRLLKTEHPDYVAEYDKIQFNRFGNKEAITTKVKPLVTTVVLFILLSNICKAQQLEGNWKEHKSGSIVQVYKANGLY